MIRIGLGSPSTSGCVAANSSAIKWSTFTDSRVGILHAMRCLDLDVIILPGARLQPDFIPPAGWGIKTFCRRGQQSYDSCAILWKSSLGTCSPIEDIGGDRRLHALMPRDGDSPLFVSGVYLPATNANHSVEDWCHELDLLSQDLDCLRDRFLPPDSSAGTKLDHVLFGDMNVQPGSLGAGPDKLPAKEQAWNRFVQKHELTLLNTHLGNSETELVELPIRKKAAKIRTGDMHHHIFGGASRAIDLVCATCKIDAALTIHNSLHCNIAGDCRLHNCHPE